MTLQSLGVAFSHGLISSLSACVYPLIPITTAIFGAGRVGHWLEGFILSGIYVAGMSITYVTIGLVAALGGTVFGSYMGSPEVIYLFAALFFLLGLGFLGVIPLPIPNFAEKIHLKKSSSIFYPLILGIFSGFIAAPCTAPLFGALLIDIARNSAENQSILPGIVQALAFSLGMGLPFLFIGGFALKLPKPGSWMNVVKYVGASILIASGFHYLEDVMGPFPDYDLLIQYAIIGAAIYVIFMWLSAPKEEMMPGFRGKLMTGSFVTIAAIGLFLATSPIVRSDIQVVKPVHTDHDGHDHGSHNRSGLVWHPELDEGLETVEPGGLVLVDFWAEWCAACKKMESELFTDPDFKTLVKKYKLTLIRIDFTEIDSPEKEEIAERYQIQGLPFLAITDKTGILLDNMLGFKNKSTALDQLNEIFSGLN